MHDVALLSGWLTRSELREYVDRTGDVSMIDVTNLDSVSKAFPLGRPAAFQCAGCGAPFDISAACSYCLLPRPR